MHLKSKVDFVFAGLVILVGASLYHQTYLISEGLVVGLGAAAFPRIILIVTMALAAILAVQSVGFERRDHDGSPAEASRFDVGTCAYRVGLMLLLGGYIALLPIVGYLPMTIAFMFCCMVYLGYRTVRSIVIYLLISCVVSYCLKYVFGDMLQLFLP